MGFDGLGSWFFWKSEGHSNPQLILLKLTKKHHEGSAHFNWGFHPTLQSRTLRSELLIFIKGCIYTFVNEICWWKDCRPWKYISKTHQQGIWWSRIKEKNVAGPEGRVEDGIKILGSNIVKEALDGTWCSRAQENSRGSLRALRARPWACMNLRGTQPACTGY